ncbi:hypothetical protein KC963_01005 [Candidatus Saccharibacteria bacterium]|nr:hypothetical protein [Candidatus Saccharibacteria bacterium]
MIYTRPGNKAVKAIIVIALALIIVFAIVNRASAPSEGEVSDEADTMMEESGMMKDDGATMEKLPPPPTPPTASCGEKNSVCETNDDCCGNMGLECQDVRTATGGFGKRCLPVEVLVCRSECVNGKWAKQTNCKALVAPDSMVSCESFVGTDCKTSVSADRNNRECWDT